MATNNKNRFIGLPSSDWISYALRPRATGQENILFTTPIDMITPWGVTSLALHAIFGNNNIAFLCDRDGKIILRHSGENYYTTIEHPIVNLAPYGKDGIISSPTRSATISINYRKTAGSNEARVEYETKKVTSITETIKDFKWRNTGQGPIGLSCVTRGWGDSKDDNLSSLSTGVHDTLIKELDDKEYWPVPDVLGITDGENTERDSRESLIIYDIGWPIEGENKLSYSRTIDVVCNVRYDRTERTTCTRSWDEAPNDDKLTDYFEPYVKETFISNNTSKDQFALAFPLLLGSSKIEITASISTSITSNTEGGRELKAEELANVPVFITWGKIGDKLTSENGCILDATMPDLGANGKGATKGYPTFTGVASQSDGLIQIMMDDESEHSKICDVPETHAMWFKVGYGIRELFNELGKITLLEEKGEPPPGHDDQLGSYYIKLGKYTSVNIAVSAKIKVKVVG